MKKADFIDAVVAQEDFDFYSKRPMGNLQVRTDPPVGRYIRKRGEYAGTRAQVTNAQLYYYEVALWGASFKMAADGFVRPQFEFVNIAKYSVSTSANQRKVYSAIEAAPRHYTPCLVVDPKDSGGRHWELRDWATITVALDWCAENGLYGGWSGPSPDLREVEAKGRAMFNEALRVDAFWILQTTSRTPHL